MAHNVYIRFIVISKFLKLHFVLHSLLLRNFYSPDAHHANHGKSSLKDHFWHGAHSVYKILHCFQTFRNCSLFCTFWLFRNFYCGDAHHSNHGKHSLNRHFWHGAHSVYAIYSDFKLFEIAVCFAHFDFFEISTPVMRIIVTIANIV